MIKTSNFCFCVVLDKKLSRLAPYCDGGAYYLRAKGRYKEKYFAAFSLRCLPWKAQCQLCFVVSLAARLKEHPGSRNRKVRKSLPLENQTI
jgi:hypothetical protein